MSANNLIAIAETNLDVPVEKVWDALVNPELIKQYMFGTTVICDWKVGSKITWKGEWQGTTYEDYGKILEIEPLKKLAYNHYSPMTGEEDVPENYRTVTVTLEKQGNQTHIKLVQDNNRDEEARKHSEQNWTAMLQEMRQLLENNQ